MLYVHYVFHVHPLLTSLTTGLYATNQHNISRGDKVCHHRFFVSSKRVSLQYLQGQGRMKATSSQLQINTSSLNTPLGSYWLKKYQWPSEEWMLQPPAMPSRQAHQGNCPEIMVHSVFQTHSVMDILQATCRFQVTLMVCILISQEPRSLGIILQSCQSSL